MAVDERVVQPLGPDEALGVDDPLGDHVAHHFLADELGAARRDADDPEVVAEDLDLRLIPEAAGVDVDGVPETGEGFGEPEDVDDLAPGVGSPEFGLA